MEKNMFAPTSSYNSPRTKPLYRGTQLMWYLVGLVEVMLAFRFGLKLLGANPRAGFTEFIYNLTHPLVAPFLSVFRISQVEGSVLEWTTILAMFVYWLIGWGIVKIFLMGREVSTPEAAQKLARQEK